jgi:hypothetical protein
VHQHCCGIGTGHRHGRREMKRLHYLALGSNVGSNVSPGRYARRAPGWP